jgi:hypothetical protein
VLTAARYSPTFDLGGMDTPDKASGRRKAGVRGYGLAPELDAGRRARARLTGAAVAKLR